MVQFLVRLKDRLNDASVTVKVLIICSLIFITANALFSLYAGTFLLQKDTGKPAAENMVKPRTNGSSEKSIQEIEYEKAFIKHYNDWISINDVLMYKINDRSKVVTIWDSEIAKTVSRMNVLVRNTNAIAPPDKYIEAQENYMNAIAEYSFTASNIENAVKDKDIDLLASSMKKLLRGTSYLNLAFNQFQKAQ